MLQAITIEMRNRSMNMVGKYFYKEISESLTEIQCQAQCVYDEEQPCHFSMRSNLSENCYLGNFFVGIPIANEETEDSIISIYLSKSTIS